MQERLREVDANLILALHALLEEPNLTRAGQRLAMSQPAMSGALTRLRTHFGDELLVRVSRGFVLTPYAESLREPVRLAVEAADALLGSAREFDPSHSAKRFTVSMSEYAMSVLAKPLTELLSRQCPNCSVDFDTLVATPEEFETQLMRRDVIISPQGFDFPGRQQPVFTDELVCVVARDNPYLVDGSLSVSALASMPHAVAQFAAAGGRTRPLERALDSVGLASRTVLVSVTSLLVLPFAVSGTDMCAFVPRRLARRTAGLLDLTVATTPVPRVTIVEAARWHPRRESDPAVTWVRRLLHDVAVAVEDEVS